MPNSLSGSGSAAWGKAQCFAAIFLSFCKTRLVGRDLLYQIYFIGVKSQSVVAVTGAFTGMVLCAQSYFQFHKIKLDTATLAVVSISMCSELGPVLTALMVAGRVGAAIAAEIGTMRVTKPIDALRTLAAHPIDYLVTPFGDAAGDAAVDGGIHRSRNFRGLRHRRCSRRPIPSCWRRSAPLSTILATSGPA